MGHPSKKETIALDELDPRFREVIASQPGGENIKRCFACGTCSAICPLTEVDARFNPRKIIRMSLLGMKSEVLSSDFIWLCSNCHFCYEMCPQDVRFTSIIHAIRNIAIHEMKERGGSISAPGFLFASSFIQTVKDYGRMWEPRLILRYFAKKKDFKGILAYIPLGMKLFRKGKIPLLPSRGGRIKHIFKNIEEGER